jgi:multidrug efflux pump subunit AcrA (membrane-fusion protein)
MRLRRFLAPALGLAAASGLAAVAAATRERWVPLVFPPAPAAKAGPDHDDHDHDELPDRVKLTPQAQANLGLDRPGAVGTLTPQAYWRKIVIPGVVVDRPGESDRGVTSKVTGVVTEIRARPGDTVRPGDPLFTLGLASEFLQGAQNDLAKAARELEFAAARRDRTADLVKAGTQSAGVLAEEENNVKRLATHVRALRRQLQVFGLSPADVDRAENGDPVTEVVIHAPARAAGDGPPPPAGGGVFEVQDLKVTLGEQVQAGQTLCVLSDHGRLFVEGRAFKSEATALADVAENRTGIEAEFADEPPGGWGTAVPPLHIRHLSNVVDPQTRTFAFYLPLENEARAFTRDGRTHLVWRFRPGQRVRLRVPVEKLGDDVFVLPAGAVVREGAEAFVFVQAGDVYRRKPVRVLHADRDEAVIARDGSVSAAELVVRTPAAAALNRAVKAAAGDGGHGHDHDH